MDTVKEDSNWVDLPFGIDRFEGEDRKEYKGIKLTAKGKDIFIKATKTVNGQRVSILVKPSNFELLGFGQLIVEIAKLRMMDDVVATAKW